MEIFPLFSTKDFMPHGQCFLWKPDILGLHVTSDAIIALSYYVMPVAFFYYMKKKEETQFTRIYYFFIVFFILCGTSHLFSIITIWNPQYWAEGFIKAGTAITSIVSATLIIWVMPKALSFPSPENLLVINQTLQEEIESRKIYQSKLESAKFEAEKSNRAKSEFLARMSHELRTPMNSILGFGQLLQMDSDNLTGLQKKNTERIISAGDHLLELINEVLDLSKVESGKMKLSMEVVDVIPVVDEVISLSKALATEKNVSLEYQKKSGESWFVKIDQLRFKQVVFNLISNAIKYNKPDGSVVIFYEELGSGMLRLGVRDTGHGIAEDKKERLFKPFERFDVDAETIEGTGIGLTITKQLVEMMKGTISFESTAGKGSFFYVDVPVCNKVTLAHVEEKAKTIQPSLNNDNVKKVLYVEDTATNIELVKQILTKSENIRLLFASNALAGIELAQSEIPDLILMDIHMPGMDGLTAFKKLQTINETKDIPVIALTADAMDVDIKKAMNMGFKDYITKPINVAKFLKSVDDVFVG